MAVVDEMLETEPASRTLQLVGAVGVAHGRAGALGVEAAQNQWAELHLAAVYVRLGLAGRDDGQDGQDLLRQTVADKITQRIAGDNPPQSMAIPARRLWRFAGRMEAS